MAAAGVDAADVRLRRDGHERQLAAGAVQRTRGVVAVVRGLPRGVQYGQVEGGALAADAHCARRRVVRVAAVYRTVFVHLHIYIWKSSAIERTRTVLVEHKDF